VGDAGGAGAWWMCASRKPAWSWRGPAGPPARLPKEAKKTPGERRRAAAPTRVVATAMLSREVEAGQISANARVPREPGARPGQIPQGSRIFSWALERRHSQNADELETWS